MTAYVHQGADIQMVSPFVHTLEPSAYDCGLQQLSIVEDGAFGYPYSAIMSVSAQITKTDNLILLASSTDYTHVNSHTVQMTVSLVSWPDVTLTAAAFTVEIKACTITNS